jgi:acyl carrier protein
MSRQDNETKLRALLTQVSKQDATQVPLDADLPEALDLDSLAALSLLAAVEKRFALRFPDDRLSELRSLGRLLDALETAAKEERA